MSAPAFPYLLLPSIWSSRNRARRRERGDGARASFLAFSGIVTALSTFFLSDDLRLLFAAPVASRRLFHARFLRTVAQSSWMVVVFIVPVLAGVGLAHCAPAAYYPMALLAVTPFVMIPVAIGA